MEKLQNFQQKNGLKSKSVLHCKSGIPYSSIVVNSIEYKAETFTCNYFFFNLLE